MSTESIAVGQPILSCSDLKKSFLGVAAVTGATFDVPKGLITALIGPNGAGKTTVVNIISGMMKSDAGTVHIGSTDVTNWADYKIAALGLMRTFQLSRELGGLSVLENLLVAPRVQAGESLFNVFFRPGRTKREEAANIGRALEILKTYGLYDLRDNRAAALSGGQKKLLEIARGVMANPSILLLDEPMAGVHPSVVDEIAAVLESLRDDGLAILMVEHELAMVDRLCDPVIVMAQGRVIGRGSMTALRGQREVVEAYIAG